MRRDWTKAEEEILLQMYLTHEASELAQILARSENSIHHKANRLGLVKWVQWSEAEDNQLKELYPSCRIDDLVKILNRTKAAISFRASILGLSSIKNNREWTTTEDRYLKNQYKKRTQRELARDLDRTTSQIAVRASHLRLKKRKERSSAKSSRNRNTDIYFKQGNKIRETRRKLRLTQYDMATSLGISTVYLSMLENNRANPSYKLLSRLQKEFNIDATH